MKIEFLLPPFLKGEWGGIFGFPLKTCGNDIRGACGNDKKGGNDRVE